MRGIHARVSEEQLPCLQVKPYQPHNSLNLPRHLLQRVRSELQKGLAYDFG